MIKKLIISIITITGIGISFSNAQSLLGNLQGIGQTFGSFYNNDYEIQVNGKGNLLTQYLGDGKKMLYFQNGTYFFRSTQNDSKPYISVSAYNGDYNNRRDQGYVKYYFLCDYISDGSVVNPSNCVRHSIDDGEFPGVAKRLLNSLSNGGYLFYNYYDFYVKSTSSPAYGGLDVCFSSTEFNKSLCFYGGITYSQAYCETYYNNTLGKLFQNGGSWCTTTQSLDNTLGLEYNFDSISQSVLGNSPVGITPEEPSTNRNDNQVCPTLRQILNNYPTNYNTGMCYNNTIIYNNGQIETIDKRNIQEIFTDYEELSNRRNIYNNNCKIIYQKEKCMDAFSGNLDKYAVISKGVNENAEPKRLRNYCNIYLNYDLNTSSCVANGRQGEKFTTEEITNAILSLDNLTVQTPKTGNILNGLLDEGETRANPLDILGNIDQIKDKFTILFEERKGVNGIIPSYIIWIMLLTILLTVLFKK